MIGMRKLKKKKKKKKYISTATIKPEISWQQSKHTSHILTYSKYEREQLELKLDYLQKEPDFGVIRSPPHVSDSTQ